MPTTGWSDFLLTVEVESSISQTKIFVLYTYIYNRWRLRTLLPVPVIFFLHLLMWCTWDRQRRYFFLLRCTLARQYVAKTWMYCIWQNLLSLFPNRARSVTHNTCLRYYNKLWEILSVAKRRKACCKSSSMKKTIQIGNSNSFWFGKRN